MEMQTLSASPFVSTDVDFFSPCVYVGTYGKYNYGSISGAWIDLTQFETEEEFYSFCRQLHSDESYPEFMFQDYGGFPSEYYDESSLNFDGIREYIEMCEQHGKEAVEAFIEVFGVSCLSDFENYFVGYYGGSILDAEYIFADELAQEIYGKLIDEIGGYFDTEAFRRDLFITDFRESNGYIFRCR